MLWVNSNIEKYKEFKALFKEEHGEQFLDLSKVPSANLADEADMIVEHHSHCCVFLGFLEPGWMLEPTHQTRIRKLFRKFDVGLVTNFVESLPFSWKNEIHTFYTQYDVNRNGATSTINNGSSV